MILLFEYSRSDHILKREGVRYIIIRTTPHIYTTYNFYNKMTSLFNVTSFRKINDNINYIRKMLKILWGEFFLNVMLWNLYTSFLGGVGKLSEGFCKGVLFLIKFL